MVFAHFIWYVIRNTQFPCAAPFIQFKILVFLGQRIPSFFITLHTLQSTMFDMKITLCVFRWWFECFYVNSKISKLQTAHYNSCLFWFRVLHFAFQLFFDLAERALMQVHLDWFTFRLVFFSFDSLLTLQSYDCHIFDGNQ